jgi:hypothetical protein
MGMDFLLIKDQLGVQPFHGLIVCGDGTRHRIDNDERLRVWVLELADRIRMARRDVARSIPVKVVLRPNWLNLRTASRFRKNVLT